MKELTTCIVCGKKYIKTKRKDSADVCSHSCYLKYRRRITEGLPISDEEFRNTMSERRKLATMRRTKNAELAGYLMRDDSDSVCLCKKRDCLFMAKTCLRTCDYMLITGSRRGCPVDECDKYVSGRRPKGWAKKFK